MPKAACRLVYKGQASSSQQGRTVPISISIPKMARRLRLDHQVRAAVGLDRGILQSLYMPRDTACTQHSLHQNSSWSKLPRQESFDQLGMAPKPVALTTSDVDRGRSWDLTSFTEECADCTTTLH